MPKISVVMPVYNASRFLDESVNSILNQTMSDLELICVDDGSQDNSLEILKEFEKKDSRVKVFSLEHNGGGNARNFGLTCIAGKYLFNMDADDVLDLNAFEEFFKICEENNLDFVVFKAKNYGVEKNHYFETDYQNMTRISNHVKDSVFNYNDLGDLIFDFNVSPWCKFYNTEFIKETKAQFKNNSKFHDNKFFWDSIFKAKRIMFIDKFYYTRKRYNESLTGSGDIHHIDIIDVVNEIINLFIKHAKLERYKNLLYNFKVIWIVDRYNQLTDEENKEKFFNEMKKDFKSIKYTEFKNLLKNTEKYVYESALISKNFKDFDKLIEYYKIMKNNKSYKDKIPELNKWMNSLDESYQKIALKTLKQEFEKYDEKLETKDLIFLQNIKNSQNVIDYNVNTKISELNYKLTNASPENINKEITNLLNDYKNDLIKIKNQNNQINDLKSKLVTYNEIIHKNTIKICYLTDKNKYLTKNNEKLTSKNNHKNLIKNLISKK